MGGVQYLTVDNIRLFISNISVTDCFTSQWIEYGLLIQSHRYSIPNIIGSVVIMLCTR